ncbi:MAG: hypothetical protein UR66_C0018G0008 [Candidatus Moranbacteria bacterium GW2011_GWE1_35_17]|nr:MAG: hypothetical protein UR66_C0018G0008 [Candidatus Moranbacteria bacterium GW2011_GWE1_35_17]KKP67292.1 MAG: hypothetical protein UR65_C0073G0003 [Candidatus Moranbacteria bacterium GW2011_GWE2_35_164]KKP81191.1 MAG: hypothetical protein UR82_C0070G0004 [Candidatus Moranbacteria bacterium GW2011_GWF1_35_5]KKP83529.1 MAG: hypothetical protein UR83_C0035G0006 [Candidatus Moranbacteria bacterium GW2011_GWF2_35_54]
MQLDFNKMLNLKNKNLNPAVTIDKLKNNLSQKRAFSIGEVMLSVFILGVTMLTILTLYSSGLREFQDERDSIIASMLAQEGVELARNIRDNNWAQRDSITDISPATFENFNNWTTETDSNDCRTDISSGNVTSCGTSKVLNVDANGYYVHSAGTATKFRRTIDLDYNGDDLTVTSFVSWNGSNPPTSASSCTVIAKCVFSQTTLTDWGTGT